MFLQETALIRKSAWITSQDFKNKFKLCDLIAKFSKQLWQETTFEFLDLTIGETLQVLKSITLKKRRLLLSTDVLFSFYTTHVN